MTSPSYVYLAQDYDGHRPANRELVEVYERGAIFRIPANTTLSMDLMRILTASIVHARAEATRQGAGRKLQHEHMDTGRLTAVADIAKAGVAGAQKRATTRVLKARAIRMIPLAEDGEFAADLAEYMAKPVMSVEHEFTVTDPRLVELISGGTLHHISVGDPNGMGHVSIDHRKGCASSRNRPCTCEYIGQWDDK